eukprot:SAG22_NODE_1_length_62449_cov_158.689270_56_plen_77_part_00
MLVSPLAACSAACCRLPAAGKHAQIVEVELQREYEGKASYPNYVMSGVIDGFPEMATKIGLKDIVDKPQLKGLWTW